MVNVAVTFRAAFIVTRQVPVPEHAPDQPEKVYPLAAEAVKITDVPEPKLVEQVELQLKPQRLLVTVPASDGETFTVKLYKRDAA